HLFERSTKRRQLGGACREGGQHRGNGAALFARSCDQRFEFVGLLLDQLVLTAGDRLDGVQHVRARSTRKDEAGIGISGKSVVQPAYRRSSRSRLVLWSGRPSR